MTGPELAADHTCPDCGEPWRVHDIGPGPDLKCPVSKVQLWHGEDGGRIERRKRWDSKWPAKPRRRRGGRK